jgi:hypothetical protein
MPWALPETIFGIRGEAAAVSAPAGRRGLKFSGDLVYLVLIRGSKLDKPLSEGAINLSILVLV